MHHEARDVGAPSGTWAPLGHARFRRLALAGAGSLTCYWMTEVACAWQMRLLTDADPLRVSLVGATLQLTMMLALIPGGVLADTLDRRRLALLSHVGAAIVLALLALLAASDRLGAGLLLALLPPLALTQAIRMPIIGSLIVETVDRPALAAAVAMNSLAQNASRVLGPALAGLLLVLAGAPALLALAAAGLLLSGVLLATVPRDDAQRSSRLEPARFFEDARSELRLTRTTPWRRNLLLRLALFFLCNASIPALLPVQFASGDLYGAMLASYGAGAILGLLGLGRPLSKQAMERRAIVAQTVHAAALVALALAPSVWIAALALFVCGGCWLGVSNSLMTAAHLQLPSESRARGLSMTYATGMAGIAIGSPLWGAVARYGGTESAFLAAAVVSMLLLIATHHRAFTIAEPA